MATIANANVLLASIEWNGFGLPESTLTIAFLTIGALIGAATMIQLENIAYGLVLIWAYAGILTKHITSSGFSGQYPGVIITASICIALFIIVSLYKLVNIKKHRTDTQNIIHNS